CVAAAHRRLIMTMARQSPPSTLFPYTTLFRSIRTQPGPYESQRSRLRRAREVLDRLPRRSLRSEVARAASDPVAGVPVHHPPAQDRKSTRLNSSHVKISYAVFCLKQKDTITIH